jgi:hypothetical protein
MQARAAHAAGEEAKSILAAAIDAQVQDVVRQLKHADDALLGGESQGIAAFLQLQLQQATVAAEAPPAAALPCQPGSESAMALAAAYVSLPLTNTPHISIDLISLTGS